MIIPKQIEIGSQTISIEHRKKVLNSSAGLAVGLAYLLKNKIILSDKVKNETLAKDQINQTFIHECLHIILMQMDSDLYDDEEFVDKLASGVYQIIKQVENK
jgi:predicted SprT family Zn-dependent metalloprotease